MQNNRECLGRFVNVMKLKFHVGTPWGGESLLAIYVQPNETLVIYST